MPNLHSLSLQVLPVVCVIGCVAMYWLAEWTLRRVDPTGGCHFFANVFPQLACLPASEPAAAAAAACRPRSLCAFDCAAVCAALLSWYQSEEATLTTSLLVGFPPCQCAGEKRAEGPEAKGLVGWLMGLKLR